MINTQIPLYGIFILLSLLSNIVVVTLIYPKKIFDKYEIMGVLIYENVGILIGAKLLSCLENFFKYGNFDFTKAGLASYGAIIGALIGIIIFGIQFKKELKQILFTVIVPVPLMYAIGKIGCFLAGCCYGIKYNGIGNVVYYYSKIAPKGVHLFPIQIIETVTFIPIFIYMVIQIKNDKFTWSTLGKGFILCGTTKFILDYLRMSHVNIFISLNQIISLVFIIIGLIIIYKNKRA